MFALIGGDLAYAADKFGILSEGMQSWMDWMLAGMDVRPEKRLRWLEWLIAWKEYMITPEGRMIPIVPALGNHDVNGGFDKTPADASFFHTIFPLPGRRGYNVLDFGNYLTVVILDSGHTNPVGGKQTRWLYEALRERQFFPHKIALYHVPAYPSVRKFNGKTCSSIRHFWTPIFDRFGVHAAFEHHDHAYKRTYPLRAGKIDPSGTIFLGDGAWGVEHPRSPKNPDDVWYLAKSAPLRHFIRVTLTKESRQFTAIDSRGELIDEFESGK
jgi:acid phosphatase type 7